MIEKVERIERVARVKGIESDNNKRFNRKNGRNDAGDGKKFESTLNAAVKRDAERNVTGAAASLDLRNLPLHNIATHSLFYRVTTMDDLLAYAQ